TRSRCCCARTSTGSASPSTRTRRAGIEKRTRGCGLSLARMPTPIDFKDVSTAGLETSPHANALAGLRANEARYFKNKYDHEFVVEPASEAGTVLEWGQRIPKE